MPWAPQKPCSRTACGRLTDGRYCDRCAALVERQRVIETPWRRWYQSARWKRETKRFLGEHPFCECGECTENGWKLRATVVHHRTAHRGDADLFWSQANWSSRTKAHHDRETAREVNARR